MSYIFYFERVEINSNTVLDIDFFGPCLSPSIKHIFVIYVCLFYPITLTKHNHTYPFG